ncbi:uncharacterized protein LOC121195897 [Toxotes jaculatrix]|uniref:uncharacterized protein LOC121195897 n=1 Tax=Toxotes jaculatrix TaxID=941984 RepID=UPI001B3B1B80|nr:uncharacterized protein LOC121195897 [Toxotes jaculatrix]
MATDFTQDAVLDFLQSSGGMVKNSDLLLHFGNFIRNHADQGRNRELFKKYVNTVATVRQEDGVSYVILRKKFRGHVPGDGGGGPSGPQRLPAGKNTEPSPESSNLSSAVNTEKPRLKPQLREVTGPAPPGEAARKIVLPAAGIMSNNNNNAEMNLNLKQKQHQVNNTPEPPNRPAEAQVLTQVFEKRELSTPGLSEPPVRDQNTKMPQQRVGFYLLPGIKPVVPTFRHHGETSQQVPVPQMLRGKEACLQPEGGLRQEPQDHHVGLHAEVAPRRFRHRPSYKSAVSYDEDEEEEEEATMRRGSAGGGWPLNAPLGETGRAISSSSPCIIDQPATPSVVSSSSSSSFERNLPKIYIQDVEGEGALCPRGPGWGFESELGAKGPWSRTGLPFPDRAKEASPLHETHQDSRASGVQVEPRQGSHQSQGSSSHSSLFSPSSDAGFSSSDWPKSDSSRGSGWNSSCEDLQDKTGEPGQDVLRRSQGTKLESATHLADSKTTAGHRHDNQDSTVRVMPWHLSTGDLRDDHEDVESSEGSTSSPQLRERPVVARRLSSRLRSRMCRSLGADLDQLIHEEARGGGGGNEAARLNRLHMISSSLSLHYNLSSSSLSSCSTPPRCHSLADLVEGEEPRGGKRSFPATVASSSSAHHESHSKQSLVPLESREHAWLVNGAAGDWPKIYSLFRDDSSLLNKRDFISGFTVLHWIAKHGDHRVLNTLWYGVEKAGLMFDINARSTCGYTPLHIAAMHGNKNIIRLLVKKFCADVKLRDTAGKKPWQYLSRDAPPDIFQLLGAPARAAVGGELGVTGADTNWGQQQQHRRRRRHHLSSASSGERPLTIAGTTKVKRSSSIAAFLKHKSLLRFHGHQSDSSI